MRSPGARPGQGAVVVAQGATSLPARTHEVTSMALTPEDVRNKQFSTAKRAGYVMDEVDAFLDQIELEIGSMQRENAFNIASKEGRLLVEINDALLRLYNGQYGICEASGKPISRARLKALPWARFTLEEQERIDREMVSGRHQADE